MNSTSQTSLVRIISLSAAPLLCVLLASVNQDGLSNGLLKKPSVELHASKTLITYPCLPSGRSVSGSCPTTIDLQVALTSIAKDFNKQALYVYTVNGGSVVGEGRDVTWDLSGAGPGIYTATVEVNDNKKHRALSSVNVSIGLCGDCVICDFPCPTIFVTCYDQVKAGTPITCKVNVQPGNKSNPITYEWSARDSSGKDISERINVRGTSVSISTDGLAGKTVYTTVELKGLDPTCNNTASGSTVVKP